MAHWDAIFEETLSTGDIRSWTLHIGESFLDVPTTHAFYADVENLFHSGLSGGCDSGSYCPSEPVRRDQMAVFLLKARHGSSYAPPPCAGVFLDVACPGPFADWIEQLYAEGITGGCAGERYCPSSPVTRAQMAVFLLKAEHGPGFTPTACNGVFPDVPCPSLFADWIERLFHESITAGCGGGNYCPDGVEHPRSDGRLPRQDVRVAALRAIAGSARDTRSRRGTIPSRGRFDPIRAAHPPRRSYEEILVYGLCLGVLIAVVRLTEYRFLLVDHSVEFYGGLIAVLFAGLGIWLGISLTRKKPAVIVKEVPVAAAAPFVVDEARRNEPPSRPGS